MWDLIVSVPDHCLSLYFSLALDGSVCRSTLLCFIRVFHLSFVFSL